MINKKLKEERLKRITEKRKFIKSKKERRLMKYSDNFNEMFNFFLASYRKDILSFCGADVIVKFNKDSDDAKFSFRLFDNGKFKGKDIESIHPNILRAVIIAKKSWGLFCREWASGIADCDFTRNEIIEEFSNNNIKIPDVFLTELDNEIFKFKQLKYNNYFALKEK